MTKDDQQFFIDSLTKLIEFARKSGEKGYEFYIRDLLTYLYNDDLKKFIKDIKHCNPKGWNMNGFSNPTDKRKLNIELANIERLMKQNNISIGMWFFQHSNQLSQRLKEFD